ncbi:MAG: bifunctional hydroxymethylpyrimidine kinase/phosphomethylpyrimidine kinase [Kiritimatiellae bacterium]|nr:bifunctional hydroxymethylpyrimidine kinase/phosphomethylpyrimidine kinase [Kiritimatiellia bacterium]
MAGTDPSGGAGIQADLKVLHALGAHDGSVITALIAQNSMGVRRVWPATAAQVRAQWTVLREDIPPVTIKLGMLATAEIVREAVRAIRATGAQAVCDPVLGSTGGRALLTDSGLRAMRDLLLPAVAVLCPNRSEAERLLGRRLRRIDDVPRAAEELRALGPRAVLLKGGHFSGTVSADYFRDDRNGFWMVSPRVAARHTHGTGCALSSAFAAFLAHGRPAPEAAVLAKAYMNQALRRGAAAGSGPGHPAHDGWPARRQDFPVLRNTIASRGRD